MKTLSENLAITEENRARHYENSLETESVEETEEEEVKK